MAELPLGHQRFYDTRKSAPASCSVSGLGFDSNRVCWLKHHSVFRVVDKLGFFIFSLSAHPFGLFDPAASKAGSICKKADFAFATET